MLSPLTTSSVTQAKIRLFWVCCVHYRLSRNVVREVCQFLFHSVSILCIAPPRAWLFQAGVRVAVDIPEYYREFGEVRNYASVCIEDSKVLCCGGTANGYARVQAYLVAKTAVCEVRSMTVHRAFHAILFNDFTNTVFVFGGLQAPGSKLAQCEKFDISARHWSCIANMNAPRAQISACRHGSSAYLIGDSSQQIEVFHVDSETFSVLPKVKSPGGVLFATAVRDAIIIVTEVSLQKVELASWKIVGLWRGNFAAAHADIDGHMLYLVEDERVTAFDCRNGDSPYALESSV